MATHPRDFERQRRELQVDDPNFYAYLIDIEMAERLRSLHYTLGVLSPQAAQRVWATAEHHRGRADRRLGREAS